MAARHSEYEEIRRILEQAEEPLTAREILDDLEDPDIDSAHRVATVLGRRADTGDVDVIRDRPYRYRV
jgi:hypothetical protein